MELLKFIKEHKDWEELLQQPPYCIKISKWDDYIMLNYNQLESDFYNPIVRECRGIILNSHLRPVCVPFYKFGNYGEGYVPNIDWSSCSTQEKVDGSLIKVWWSIAGWHVSTNGTINAFECPLSLADTLQMDCPYDNFGDLFLKAMENANLYFGDLNEHYTYMFELVSPYNKVVVPYDEIKIYHIGTRDNFTFEELDIDIGVEKPKRYDLHTLEDCINSASKMPYSEEGYVVVDKNWNRIKIKSPQYVAVHHLKNNGNANIVSIIQLLRTNEIGEFLTYFPEYEKHANKIKSCMENICKIIDRNIGVLRQWGSEYMSQKDFALTVVGWEYSDFYFAWRKNPNLTPHEWLWSKTNNKIKEMIKKCLN